MQSAAHAVEPTSKPRVATRQRTGGSASQTVIRGESRGRPSIHATPRVRTARRVFRIPSWRLTSPFGVDTTAFAEGEPGSETCNQRLTRLSPRASSRVAARQRTGGSASQTVICGESRGRPSIHATPRVRTARRVEVATPTPSRVNSDHVASDPCRPTPILRIARIYAGSVELRGIEPLTS